MFKREVSVINEVGEIEEAELFCTPSGRSYALAHGRYILLGAFTILSATQVDNIQAAEGRAENDDGGK